MPEFFLELFSEEIPARMQAKAADDLARLLAEVLAGLQPRHFKTFHGPRRIACAVEIHAEIPASRTIERGPRSTAPEQAMAGFLRKHGADLAHIREEAGFFVLDRASPAVAAQTLIADVLPGLLRRFPWPKSMRWGGTSAFTWVRPLRRITCLFDGAIVPFSLRDGDDDGHGLVASNLTEGHRFHAPEVFAVASCAEWQAGLLARNVVVDAAERRAAIAAGIAKVAGDAGYSVVDDAGLLDEVAGLVEWPVSLLGRIGADYMDLPAEVMQVSMRVNQRYFALRTADGKAAPAFAFVANIAATDGGAAIIAGNERVLSARFSDARHFWDLDRRNRLDTRVAALDAITFHAKLGTQGDRVRRVAKLASIIAPLVNAEPTHAARAAMLAKADLTTGMVGEFPELQGVMGRYYATYDGEETDVAEAVQDHYLPKGPSDPVPQGSVSVAVALADKLDTLTGFFGVGETPTGSGDPYALRRAALGVIRIIRFYQLRVSLNDLVFENIREHLIGAVVRNLGVLRPIQRQVSGVEIGQKFELFGADGLVQINNSILSNVIAMSPVADMIKKYEIEKNFILDEKTSEELWDLLNTTIGPVAPAIFGETEAQKAYVSLSKLPYKEALFAAQKIIDRGEPDWPSPCYGEFGDAKDFQESLVSLRQEIFANKMKVLEQFLLERLRVQLRTEGARHDVLNAVLGAGTDDDLVRILARTDAVAALLGTEAGANLLAAYRRAANILRIEEKKDGPHDGAVEPALLQAPEEQALATALDAVAPTVATALGNEDFTAAMAEMARLRPSVYAFFDAIQVNADDAALRKNRLRLLARLRGVMNQVADFSRIDG